MEINKENILDEEKLEQAAGGAGQPGYGAGRWRVKVSQHVVQAGETYTSIANMYGITREELIAYNHLNGAPWHAGMTVTIAEWIPASGYRRGY